MFQILIVTILDINVNYKNVWEKPTKVEFFK